MLSGRIWQATRRVDRRGELRSGSSGVTPEAKRMWCGRVDFGCCTLVGAAILRRPAPGRHPSSSSHSSRLSTSLLKARHGHRPSGNSSSASTSASQLPASHGHRASSKSLSGSTSSSQLPASHDHRPSSSFRLDTISISQLSVSWPPSLQQLKFGHYFNEAIERVAWPRCLEKSCSVSALTDRLRGLHSRGSLWKLEFGPLFNQPIAEVTWPASLQDLSFGNHEQELGVDFCNSNQAIDEVVRPASMRRLTLGLLFRQSLRELGALMPYLEGLTLLVDNNSIAAGIEWPKALKNVKVFEWGVGDGPVVIPPTEELVLGTVNFLDH